jgi:hypothetical protein
MNNNVSMARKFVEAMAIDANFHSLRLARELGICE